LTGASCRRLMVRVSQAEPGGKVARMLAVADGLILVTWLPDPPAVPTDPPQLFDPTRRNMEHIAATAAAIQNMLLTATATGVHTYWSSGGLLRDQPMLDSLSIPPEQVLLGAVYLFPPEAPSATTKTGALRGRQGEPGHWMRWVSL
jgi:nitroreductase